MSEAGQSCGTGLGGYTPPGDPVLTDTFLTTTIAYGGVMVRWTLPSFLPHAVSHVRILRSQSPAFETANLVGTTGGTSHFDPLDPAEPTLYYYWIRLVSVNGTVGSEIGPSEITVGRTIDQIIALMEGQLAESALNEHLRSSIADITRLESALSDEEQTRLFGDALMTNLLGDFQGILDQQGAFLANEVLVRQEEYQTLITAMNVISAEYEGNSAAILALSRVFSDAEQAYALVFDRVESKFDEQIAVIQQEQITFANANKAVALDVKTLQTAVSGTLVSLQEQFLIINDPSTGIATAEYFIKTDVNGYISGFGIHNDGEVAEFIVNVDRFGIGDPSKPDVFPFIVAKVNGTYAIALNAKTLIPDASIGSATIIDAAIETLHLQGEAVTVPRGSSTVRVVCATGATSWKTAATLGLNPKGGRVLCTYTASVSYPDDFAIDVGIFQVTNGVETLRVTHRVQIRANGGVDVSGAIPVSVTFLSGALSGWHSFRIRAKWAGLHNGATLEKGYLTVTGFQR